MINDGLRTLLFMLIPIAGALTGALIVRTVFDIINRKRKSDIAQVAAECNAYKLKYSAACERVASLTAENIVLRGLNHAIEAENNELRGENTDLQEGKTVIHLRGRKIEVL